MESKSAAAINNKLGRASFALRLAVFLLVGVSVLVVAKVGLILLVDKLGEAHWPIYLFFAGEIIGALWLLTIAAFNVYFFVVKAALPRLTDIGLHGSMRSWVAALMFAYPLSVLILLCMLLVPSNYISRE